MFFSQKISFLTSDLKFLQKKFWCDLLSSDMNPLHNCKHDLSTQTNNSVIIAHSKSLPLGRGHKRRLIFLMTCLPSGGIPVNCQRAAQPIPSGSYHEERLKGTRRPQDFTLHCSFLLSMCVCNSSHSIVTCK